MSTKWSKYLNQKVQWERCIGHNEYGKAEYDEVREIKVRKVDMQKLITDDYGRQVVTKTMVLTTDVVAVGDLIDGERVVSVESAVDRWGRVVGRQAYLVNRE
jgi:hypothetical protein